MYEIQLFQQSFSIVMVNKTLNENTSPAPPRSVDLYSKNTKYKKIKILYLTAAAGADFCSRISKTHELEPTKKRSSPHELFFNKYRLFQNMLVETNKIITIIKIIKRRKSQQNDRYHRNFTNFINFRKLQFNKLFSLKQTELYQNNNNQLF